MSRSHRCVAPGCARSIPYHLLMCNRHWKLLPPAVQRDVYATWRSGKGAGTPEHEAAIRDAINSLPPEKRDA